MTKIIVYADDRTALGQEALKLITDAGGLIVTIPMNGGLPFAVRGRARYNGLEEIKLLANELRNGR